MPRTSHTLGPGVFTIGAGALAVEVQLTNIRIDWTEQVSAADDLDFLDGTTDKGDTTATYDAVVAGNVLQDDLAAAGFVSFTWAEKGTEQAFTFQPNTGIARKVTGTCVPVPVTIGGDTKRKNRSDFTFRCTVDPVLGNVV